MGWPSPIKAAPPIQIAQIIRDNSRRGTTKHVGTLEFYAAKIGFSEPRVILNFVDYLRRQEVKGHWPCPCGSGEILRKCHRNKLTELRAEISRTVASRSFERLVGSAPQVLEGRRRI